MLVCIVSHLFHFVYREYILFYILFKKNRHRFTNICRFPVPCLFVILHKRQLVVQSVWFECHFFCNVVFSDGSCEAAWFDKTFSEYFVVCLVHRLALLSLSLHQWGSKISVCETVLQHNWERGVIKMMCCFPTLHRTHLLKWTNSIFLTSIRQNIPTSILLRCA